MMHKLSDICHLEKGKIGIQKAIPGNYPLVVTAEERQSSNQYQFDCNACCIPLVSSTGHGHASLKRVHYQSGKFALGNILCAVIPNDENFVLAEYLYVYFSVFKDELLVPLMKGAANVSLTVNSLKNVEVEVPSIEVQKCIIEKYNNVVNCISNIIKYNEETNICVYKLKKKIMDELISGVFSENTKNNLYGKFPIPSNWEWKKIKDICTYQNGYNFSKIDYSKDGVGIPVIKSNNIMSLKVELNAKTDFVPKLITKYSNFIIKRNDLLMCLSSQSPSLEPLAKTAIYESDSLALLNQRVLKLTAYDSSYSKYLYYALNSQYAHDGISKQARGSGQSNLKLEHVLEFEIPFPPKQEVGNYINKMETIFDNIDKIDNIQTLNIEYVNLILRAFMNNILENLNN